MDTEKKIYKVDAVIRPEKLEELRIDSMLLVLPG